MILDIVLLMTVTLHHLIFRENLVRVIRFFCRVITVPWKSLKNFSGPGKSLKTE